MSDQLGAACSGYVDAQGSYFCAPCWRDEANAGRHPTETLHAKADGPEDEARNFWVVDTCTGCGGPIRYKSVLRLM